MVKKKAGTCVHHSSACRVLEDQIRPLRKHTSLDSFWGEKKEKKREKGWRCILCTNDELTHPLR